MSPTLKKSGLLLTAAMLSGVLFELAAFRRGVERARSLASSAQRFERRVPVRSHSIVVLGDSTGVGVGASLPEESIAGLLAADFPGADIVNVSESGARVSTAIAQAARCIEEGQQFDIALLHVGGNDVVRGTPPDRLSDECETLMLELRRLARRTVWLGPPNVGSIPLFPLPYSWLLAARSRTASRIFSESAARHDADFVDFSAPEHGAHFRRSRRQHFADDRFHPNSSSYRYGYAAARQAMKLGAAPEGRTAFAD